MPERCEWSDLLREHCAHCLGIALQWEVNGE